ncbi:uncharacterized protein BDR25DRAFT_244050 [Lindgomyces ingoldianus]|uniref:Uncharacterized protein n=1 Tax=Lindgomyces ingoldianus TaxID=673940 RepID=A0ACB6QCV1_9PLEO|nr:uncharacterized protein BDR25DRAFT_244050 [Lindgomyces ingoldianus]KAF2463942.1 hypothetical protein BDR25DRAFT_244050 [Lindgomyces ingoldianus]
MCSQTQSPLFGVIPAEIRNEIFWLALQEFDNPETLYPRETYYTRPGQMGPKRIEVALLRTCKRVYEETKVIPLSNTVACIYLGSQMRAPKDYIRVGEVFELHHIRRFRAQYWSALKHVHILAQLYALNAQNIHHVFLQNHLRPAISPSTVTITIRYTDWWYWEQNTAHQLTVHEVVEWGRMLFPDSVTEIVLELETIETKVKEVDAIVAMITRTPHQWAFGRRDGIRMLPSLKKGVKEWKWQGPTTFGERSRVSRDHIIYPHHPKGDTMGYVVKALTWVPEALTRGGPSSGE